jgi:hypothetical protein
LSLFFGCVVLSFCLFFLCFVVVVLRPVGLDAGAAAPPPGMG